MPDQAQGLIDIARGDAQANASKMQNSWEPQKQQAQINQDQAVSDRLSSPNHRLSVVKAHPSTVPSNPSTSGPHPASVVQ